MKHAAAALLATALLGGARADDAPSYLGGLDLSSPAARFRLPSALREVSGLAVRRGPDGRERLLAHDDERALVWALDPGTGAVLSRFAVGEPVRRGDFEGIAAAADGRVFLTTSDGVLYEFRVPAEGAAAEARRVDTGFGAVCEIEGLASEPGERTLLFLCKHARERALRHRVALLRWALDEGAPGRPPRAVLSEGRAAGGEARLRPADLARVPGASRYVFVDSRERRLVEITPEGEVVARARLSASRHRQPEGLAILANGSLAVADEGAGAEPTLTIYARRAAGAR